jgi:cytochrome oxidase assembly protein ShyY1
MIETGVRQHSVAGFGVFTLIMVALFVGLGVWQLQRRVEKHALIAALTERLAAAPGPLPSASQWSALTPASDEFRHVSFAATYQSRPDAMVYSSGSSVREDISGPGTWAFLPARLPSGQTIVVNAGFVQNTMQDRAQQDRAVVRLITNEPVTLTGYIRFPERRHADAAGKSSQTALVHAGSSCDGAGARLGRARQASRPVLHRSGAAGAGERHPETRPASGSSQGRSPAIRHHLVRIGWRGGDRVRGVVEGAAAGCGIPRVRLLTMA